MASSKLMSTNPSSPRVHSPSTQHYLTNKTGLGCSVNMEEIMKNIYEDDPDNTFRTNTADEDWKEIVAGRETEMTLEDFLTKAGAQETGFGNAVGTVVVGRGKRRATVVEEPVLDKATQQKQRRMIKNRESAARSRERKQAYTVELEALVTQLEEENARLVRQEAEESKKRLKQLMENLIPVEDKRKPPRFQTLRRSNSMSW